ncbi:MULTISPECIES: winged helix-turn-helix transcriptional regulator [unclassified Saccharopolyspora]|uniref:winged helix-turn-helix transcriptional regulator n=1 Tax=unclassified Saccharopolyspora TaxID=2646250 RepID=UPI001CD770DC|nr:MULTISPECIES: winged helix-turn-helix transcriptional regulator [unclassified Saccharopolyspora]MCA1188254.1 AsnC family transcriptional regulator [Saccharopolyspora sp. 6T]MCA1194038.1 AsnC family transcriptional regulator [Saccharopolyspora sp. 6V]MCA1225626.1 AsnC family transcriptional regulator [Saccharopolyspora sp. 6M]MCA1281513.1 AsnC family transcriptional regulator [Saccharopolyspora sp. 7B]
MIDPVDGKVLRALQCSPRASFRRIADVAGVSEQTAARCYRALRRDGVVRVVGLVRPGGPGDARWLARIRCRPDRVEPLAGSLARRSDVAYLALASGGSEIVCIVRSPVGAWHDDLLLQRLPRASSVLDLSIDLLLHPFGEPGTAEWTGFAPDFAPDGLRRLAAGASGEPSPDGSTSGEPSPDEPSPGGSSSAGSSPGRSRPAGSSPGGPSDADAPLLAALAEDGRATRAELAATTGWPPNRVARRMDVLRSCGALAYGVDLLPDKLGFHLHATLLLRVAPADLERAGTALAGHAETAYAGAISGAHNLVAIVVCRDAEHLYRYLTSQVAAIPGILGHQVSIRGRRVKQAGSLITHGRLVPM